MTSNFIPKAHFFILLMSNTFDLYKYQDGFNRGSYEGYTGLPYQLDFEHKTDSYKAGYKDGFPHGEKQRLIDEKDKTEKIRLKLENQLNL